MTFPPKRPRENFCTKHPFHLTAWHDRMRDLALAPAAAYARAVVAHRAHEGAQDVPPPMALGYRQPARGPALGYRLYLVAGESLAWREVGIFPEGSLVIGRHSRCDLILDGDAVSLRHVLVRATLLDDGVSVISVLDLDSASGFELSDGTTHRAVVAHGALVFRIGAAWLVALPLGVPPSNSLERPRIQAAAMGSFSADPRDAHRLAVSRILSLPGTTLASNVAIPGPGARYELAMTFHGQRAGAWFTERELEHGVLVGRATKCWSAGLRVMAEQSAKVSRVHALLIRERDGIRLYDLASENGTSDGVRAHVRSMPLAERRGERSIAYFNASPPLVVEWRVVG